MEQQSYEKPKKGKIVAKAFLWLSCVPYALLIINAICSAIFGFTFFFSTSYGLDAFLSAILISGYGLVMVYPVLPICLVYQIICLFLLIKKKLSKRSFKRLIIVLSSVAAVFVLLFSSPYIYDFYYKHKPINETTLELIRVYEQIFEEHEISKNVTVMYAEKNDKNKYDYISLSRNEMHPYSNTEIIAAIIEIANFAKENRGLFNYNTIKIDFLPTFGVQEKGKKSNIVSNYQITIEFFENGEHYTVLRLQCLSGFIDYEKLDFYGINDVYIDGVIQ